MERIARKFYSGKDDTSVESKIESFMKKTILQNAMKVFYSRNDDADSSNNTNKTSVQCKDIISHHLTQSGEQLSVTKVFMKLNRRRGAVFSSSVDQLNAVYIEPSPKK